MIIAYKNYKRTERLLLSIESVKHFMPKSDVICLFLYDESPEECYIDSKIIESKKVKVYFEKSKYRLGPGAFSESNGFYFTEYLNYFSNILSNKKKAILLDEDNYFTTGETLRWMNDTEFDLAWAKWHCPNGWGMNASIIGINFEKLGVLFPLPERAEYIESLLEKELYKKAKNMGAKLKEIPTRNNHDYFGDGSWTNDINQMRRHLLEAKIIGG